MEDHPTPDNQLDRRDFLKVSLSAAAAASVAPGVAVASPSGKAATLIDAFDRPDSFYHGDGWESMNPGYWMIQDGALRRRLDQLGKLRPGEWFPWHYETHQNAPMPTVYDPSLPFGMIWRRDWQMTGNYSVRIEATIIARPPVEADTPDWLHHQPGYGLLGIGFGSRCLHESWSGTGADASAWMAAWRDDGRFGLYAHADEAETPAHSGAEVQGSAPMPGQKATIELIVDGNDDTHARVTAHLRLGGETQTVVANDVERTTVTNGYFGLVARGLLDFQIDEVHLEANTNELLDAPQNDLHVCYALGDTLQREDGQWRCRFVALFRNDGKEAAIRVATAERPAGGWGNVAVAGTAPVISNEFRRNTAVIDVILPANPADATLYYTVWKDGEDVTADPRIGTASVGPGTGMIGTVPGDGGYVGRLPQLKAPYRLCGLSCHAIHGSRPDLPDGGKFEAWYVHDQPSPHSWQHLEAFDYQVMLWEDDVWYLELMFSPPSTDDAYKVIHTTLAGPTTRWQMMRHWNVINPGDHDYGMDDVKGPEQIIIRNQDGLGQDAEYMRRNFQLVQHVSMGEETPSATANPKRWRRWKMPNGDFSLLILDGRLWRSSQDTNIWDDQGWGEFESLYKRQDPTRSLLGEEQFAWLQQIIRTDSAPLICLTGINGMHTVWPGVYWGEHAANPQFNQRDRVAADYAGWVSAGADRVIELLGSRTGVVSVYGDVHNGCIMRNSEHRVWECSFGPIGRYGGRAVKPEFGPTMVDYDGRALEVVALYHQHYESPELKPIEDDRYWNALELHLDPRGADPVIEIKVRNLNDAPTDTPRGGGFASTTASETGRPIASRLPAIETLPNADVLIALLDGQPLRGVRALADGRVPLEGLADVAPGTVLLVTAHAGDVAAAQIVTTEPA